jgi:peptide deformylase
MHTGIQLPRRQLLLLSAASAAAALGCAGREVPSATPPSPSPRTAPSTPAPAPPAPALTEAERAELAAAGDALPIVQREDGGRGVLRRRSAPLTPGDLPHVGALERRLRATLEASGRGVGLAAPQVGLGVCAVLVMLDARGEAPHVELFVNPRIVERGDASELDYEGCLSIPGVCGLVRRSRALVLEHGLPGEPRRRLEVADFDARIFQHELDHLDGVLYLDRVEGKLQPIERIKELREELRREQPLALLPAPGPDRVVLL